MRNINCITGHEKHSVQKILQENSESVSDRVTREVLQVIAVNRLDRRLHQLEVVQVFALILAAPARIHQHQQQVKQAAEDPRRRRRQEQKHQQEQALGQHDEKRAHDAAWKKKVNTFLYYKKLKLPGASNAG